LLVDYGFITFVLQLGSTAYIKLIKLFID